MKKFNIKILTTKISQMDPEEYESFCDFAIQRSMLDKNSLRVSDLTTDFIAKYQDCLSEDSHGIARLG
jgi:hypothetical protein